MTGGGNFPCHWQKLGGRLSLNPAGGVAASQRLYLGHADKVEIMLNGMFQAGCCHRKVDRVLIGLADQLRVDQAAAKAVAAAYTIHNMDAVSGREDRFAVFVQHSRPVIVAGRNAAPEGDSNFSDSDSCRATEI